MVLVSNAIDCKVDVGAVAHELNMSMQHWRYVTDRDTTLGGTVFFLTLFRSMFEAHKQDTTTNTII